MSEIVTQESIGPRGLETQTELQEELQEGLPDRYTIKQQIGRGGMATVFLAEESQPARNVAIKVLDPDVTTRLTRRRFLREIEVVSGLIHPHIVPIFAAGEAGELLYYVMPFIEGETVRHYLARVRTLGVEEALHIAWDVADALHYAHDHGVIHRDIKPENILLSGGHAVVSDFGVARAITCADCGEEVQPITQAGVPIGTPLYMSPEQAAGDADMDGRTDIYSLGCVLYEMLTGEAPYTGGTMYEIMMRHSQAPVPKVKTPVGSPPAAIRRAITKAMSKDPADRFETAGEFAEALHLSRASVEAQAISGNRLRTGIVVAGALLTLAIAAVLLLIGN